MGPDRRLSRFLHLERARPTGPQPRPEANAGTEERIAAVEGPAPRPAGRRPATGARLERFGPEPEPSIELAETKGRRPFVRCHRCGADNNLGATACQGCGTSLNTPEQHHFDERFWAGREDEAEREARAEALRAKAGEGEAGERARQALGEAIAREVGECQRRRLGGGFGRASSGGPWSPLGLRLVGLIPDARWHIPTMSVAAAAAAVLAGYGVHLHSWVLMLGGGLALLLLLVDDPF